MGHCHPVNERVVALPADAARRRRRRRRHRKSQRLRD